MKQNKVYMVTREIINSAVEDLAVGAQEVYGGKLKDFLLYGSCARGGHEEDSDVNVIILLDVPKEELRDERRRLKCIESSLDKKYEYEVLFSLVFRCYDEFKYWADVLPFYKNVIREGISYLPNI